MTTIIDKLAQLEGIQHLPEIDPNKQSSPLQSNDPSAKIQQAVIPAVLAGFYKFTRNEENAATILLADESSDWINTLFGDERKNVLQKISDYAVVSTATAEAKMEQVADNAVKILKEDVQAKDGKAVKNYFTDQRNAILHHLPAVLEIGNILNDTTLDDRTNKMSGPVSGLMHAIEKTFASTDSEPKK